MRNRSSNAGDAGDNAYRVQKADEMAAYDSLPPLLRRALDTAAGEFSAAQAREWMDGGRSAEEVAALIVGHTQHLIQTRMAECPARPEHRRVR